jgi:hypothetical protein
MVGGVGECPRSKLDIGSEVDDVSDEVGRGNYSINREEGFTEDWAQ